MTTNWQQGLTYMGAVLAILLTHEMGHFLQTVRYHIPASYPLCIPVPFSLIGTMGAVISMDGMRANRKQIFDIGVAGPLAGLAVAVPILYIGVMQLDLSVAPRAARHPALQSRDRPLDDRVDASRVGRSGGLGLRLAAQSVLHGRLGRHADHGPEHAAGQPARRRAHDLRALRPRRLQDGPRVHDHRHRRTWC